MSIFVGRNFVLILQMNKLFLLVSLAGVLVPSLGVESQITCPQECRCTIEYFVDCSNRGLIKLPQNIDLAAREIDLSGNSFAEVPPEINYFVYLHRLNLSHNAISNLNEDVMPDLGRLELLDLSHNLINFIHRRALINNVGLTYLNLTNNKLEQYTWVPRFVRFVDMSNNIFNANKSRSIRSISVNDGDTEEGKVVVVNSRDVDKTTTAAAVNNKLEDYEYTYDSSQKSPITEGLATQFFGPRRKRETTAWVDQDFHIKQSEILAVVMMICVFACIVLCCCCFHLCSSDPRLDELQTLRLERLEKLVEEQKQEITLVKQQQPVAAPPSYEQALQIIAINNSQLHPGRRS